MAFIDMYSELRGALPKLPITFCKTLVNRAWRDIRESNLWSFNLFESNWITPPLINAGTVTVTQGSAAITFDTIVAGPALQAAQAAQPYSLITQRQFRIGVGGIYNIIALDPSFAGVYNGGATLDRPFADPGGAGLTYQVYQLYYAAPFKDHRAWISVRNPQMYIDLDLDTTRADVDSMDPQRSWYQFPTRVVSFGRDTRVGSATLGYPLFELWGQPVAPFTYQCYGVRNGLDLVNNSDTVPQPLDEELVLAKAREFAYEWAEANKDIVPRSTGPDFKFLMGKAAKEYVTLKVLYRKQDREFVLNWFVSRKNSLGGRGLGYYNTIAGFAGPSAQL
jgi:hypothetical protein